METLSKFLQSSCKTCCDGEQQASIHSPKPPRITIHDYLVRLCKYYPCRNVMIGALVLFIKLSDSEYHICCLNVHRVFLTCILLSSKFVVDEGCINTWFAKLGGITVDELNAHERALLSALEYNVYIDVKTFELAESMLNK